MKRWWMHWCWWTVNWECRFILYAHKSSSINRAILIVCRQTHIYVQSMHVFFYARRSARFPLNHHVYQVSILFASNCRDHRSQNILNDIVLERDTASACVCVCEKRANAIANHPKIFQPDCGRRKPVRTHMPNVWKKKEIANRVISQYWVDCDGWPAGLRAYLFDSLGNAHSRT